MNDYKNGPVLKNISQLQQNPSQSGTSKAGSPQAKTSQGNTPEAKANASNTAPPLETDLGALAEHLAVIADALRQSTGNPAQNARPATSATSMRPDHGSNDLAHSGVVQADAKMGRKRFAAMAREAYAVRRRRTAIFHNDELFGEPAWDILLDLYIANVENKPVSVSSACIGSAAPPTTGLRWLGVLSEQGLIAREHDPEDQRRVLVRLTDKGLTAMDEYFASLGLNP